MTNPNETHNVNELLGRVAYAAYVEARSYDMDSPQLCRWDELRPACKNAWSKACQETEADQRHVVTEETEWPVSVML